jgi:aldehyde dehydrogenase (NAD+)
MHDFRKFYIDGAWVSPTEPRDLDVINPATEQPVGVISLGSSTDVDKAVRAARIAFESFSVWSREERSALLQRIIEAMQKHLPRLGEVISDEMGAPLGLAVQIQAGAGVGHFMSALTALQTFEFEEPLGGTMIRREPIGVCGLITPWNWPINQIACKVAPALATGCTVVLKPSEVAPLCAHVFSEILEEAGVPKGVFNLVDGDGPTVGEALARHPDVDMISFTGSTRAGIQVAKASADTVKRVSQELGGKSANIILDDADLTAAIRVGVVPMLINSGQSCNAPSRMLVPAKLYDEAVRIAKSVAARSVVGDPKASGTTMGPVASKAQFDKIQGLIQRGIDEGARLVAGGPGRPDELTRGYFVRPTIFADVTNAMTIAREEIFGPVLVMIPYSDEQEAICIANDTVYGLAGYVYSGDLERARRMAKQLRAGMIHINGAQVDMNAPFGGYKQSGNGREWGREGLKEFLETKAVLGHFAEH